MRLHAESDFDCSPDELWNWFSDPRYEKRLAAETGMNTTELRCSAEGDVEVRWVKVVNEKELPRVAAKALGAKRLVYEQENRTNRGTGEMRWTVHLPVLKDKVAVSGVTTVVATATGSRRTVNGNVSVRVPLVGGRIEKAIAERFEQGFGRAAELIKELISEG